MLGPDGRIYCIPSDADRVLRIDPATHECVEIGEKRDPNPHPTNEILTLTLTLILILTLALTLTLTLTLTVTLTLTLTLALTLGGMPACSSTRRSSLS